MSLDAWQGIVAGGAGVLAMTGVMRMALDAGMTKMDMPLVLGSMFRREEGAARRLGLVAHLMNGLVFGLVYALVWWAFDVAGEGVATGLAVGLILGFVHGLIAELAMPMMGSMHPRVHERASGAAPVGGDVALPRFGFGGRGFGSMTPVGLLMAHLVFGLVWGVVFVVLI